jgi:hypothetical protein
VSKIVEQVGMSYLSTKQKLYCLRNKFSERYNFLVGGLKLQRKSRELVSDLVPVLNFKQGGLLNTWMDLTPKGAQKSFINRLVQGLHLCQMLAPFDLFKSFCARKIFRYPHVIQIVLHLLLPRIDS